MTQWSTLHSLPSRTKIKRITTTRPSPPPPSRALAIAIFYALGTAIGGATSPLLFGYLVGTGSLWSLAGGYVFAAILMLVAALAELKFGVDAEMRSLESIAEPLSSE